MQYSVPNIQHFQQKHIKSNYSTIKMYPIFRLLGGVNQLLRKPFHWAQLADDEVIHSLLTKCGVATASHIFLLIIIRESFR